MLVSKANSIFPYQGTFLYVSGMGLPHLHLKKKHDLANPQLEWISNSCYWDTYTPLSTPLPQTMTQPSYSLAVVRSLIRRVDSLCGSPGSCVALTLGVWFRTVVGKSKFLCLPIYFWSVATTLSRARCRICVLLSSFPSISLWVSWLTFGGFTLSWEADELRDTRFVHSLLIVCSNIHLMCEVGFRFPALFISKGYFRQANVLERRWKQTQCTLGGGIYSRFKEKIKNKQSKMNWSSCHTMIST